MPEEIEISDKLVKEVTERRLNELTLKKRTFIALTMGWAKREGGFEKKVPKGQLTEMEMILRISREIAEKMDLKIGSEQEKQYRLKIRQKVSQCIERDPKRKAKLRTGMKFFFKNRMACKHKKRWNNAKKSK